MTDVRLTPRELKAIKSAFQLHFNAKDHLWLFGSRVDLNKRGGDIDLYIETTCDDLSEITDRKIDFLVDLKNNLGDQKIDLIIRRLHSDEMLPIYDEAKKTGVVVV